MIENGLILWEKIKYPRTYHLSFSEGFTSDDKVLGNAKYVRKNHAPTDKHWSFQSIKKK